MLIAQNGQFDAEVIWSEWGVWIGPWDDTMYQAHAADPGAPKSLAFLAATWLAYSPYKAARVAVKEGD